MFKSDPLDTFDRSCPLFQVLAPAWGTIAAFLGLIGFECCFSAVAAEIFTMTCQSALTCREGCGACCIAPSITSPLPGMPAGKAAGQACAQLLPDMRCAVFGRPERPDFCGGLRPSHEMCGESREAALLWLTQLEAMTAPASRSDGGHA